MADDRRLFARPDAPHGVHDLLLIAAFAAGDAADDGVRAEALVAACDQCRSLVDDLRTIQRATAALPATARAVVRPRDFRITPADAERLRPTGMRRLVAAVTHPRLSRAQPIAAGLTMLGLAGLLVSTISFGGSAASPGAASTSVEQDSRQLQAATEHPAATEDPAAAFGAQGAGGEPASSAENDLSELITPAPEIVPQELAAPPGAAQSFPRTAVAMASVLLVAGGLGLFVVADRHRRRFR